MSRFYVGQRVRINSPKEVFHGCETTIRRIGVKGADYGRWFLGAEVDCYMNHPVWPYAVYEYHELIPIDDANEPAAFETSIWQPKSRDVVST